MALTRRCFLAVGSSSILVAATAGCGHVGPKTAGASSAYNELFSVQRKGAKGQILVLMPATPQTKEVWTGLSDELGKSYDLTAVEVATKSDVDIVRTALERHRPVAIVLMNNPTVAAYAEYQRSCPPNTQFPAAVIVMTSFLDGQPNVIQNGTGIAYEIPLITVVTNLRKVLATPMHRIGVVRRAQLRTFVERQAKLAAHEKIQVEQEEVGPSPNPSELKRALRLVRQRSDALWVLNDDHLLSPRLIVEAWLPGVTERPWIPTIVGAAPLVLPGESFGTFAVLPDHTALGVQAASLLFDLADEDWKIEPGARIALPVSTTTTLDLPQVKERFTLRDGALSQVDKILK